MSERWRAVVGYEGRYEVSDRGEVFSLKSERVLSPGHHQAGYPRVMLCDTSGARSVLIHRLVLEAFVGPRPPGTECCHKNGNPKDNRLENLRWDTRKANAADAAEHGTRTIGERQPQAKLSDEKVRSIRALAVCGVRQSTIAAAFGVSRSVVCRVLKREIWRHVI